MDTLSLRLFQRVAELGAVSSAARDLSLSPASASARLAKLEDVLGFQLFNRTTRAVSLTTAGAEFLPYAQQSLEALEEGMGRVRGEGGAVQGTLRMTMPGSFGRQHIVPVLGAFQSRHPKLQLDLRLSDEVLDVVEGAYDLIIRNAPLKDSSVVGRKLARDQRLLVAAPKYLKERGHPTQPRDLRSHRCIVLSVGSRRWKFEDGKSIEPPRTILVNDGEAMRAMVENGLGVGVASLWSCHWSLRNGDLVEVLPDTPLLTESAIWALYPSGRRVPPKVRAMIDFLLEQFSPEPPWEVTPRKKRNKRQR